MEPAPPSEQTLTNGRYQIRLTASGSGQSLCRGLALNRWHGDPLEDRQGWFFYLRDLGSGKFWSATPAPMGSGEASHGIAPSQDGVTWRSLCEGIAATLRISVHPVDESETRELILRNESNSPRQIEVTSYLEVVLHDPRADAGHPAFLKLFVQTEFAADAAALLARRRPRANDERWPWLAQALAGAPLQQWETDRALFLGRGRDSRNPVVLTSPTPLSRSVGNVLDPVFALRTVVTLLPGAALPLRFFLGMADSREEALDMVERWRGGAAASVLGAASESAPPDNQAVTDKTDVAGLLCFNGFGGFSPNGQEYVIRLPWTEQGIRRPPMPWINVIGHEKFGCLVSEAGSICTWSRNSQANRLTPWSNDPVSDPHGDALFIRDETSGAFWTPMPGPRPAPHMHEVRHGFGYTRFASTANGITSEITVFVPEAEALRIVRWRVTNESANVRRLSLFSLQRLVLGTSSPQGGQIRTQCERATRLLSAFHPAGSEFAGPVVFACAISEGGEWSGACDAGAFIGGGDEGMACPAALRCGGSLAGQDGFPDQPGFGQQVTLDIESGAMAEGAFILGESTGADEIARLRAVFADASALDAALYQVIEGWRARVSRVRVETPLPEVDLMVNGWLAYQTLVCRIQGRTAFYQSSGAYGYRDQLQDAAGLLLLDPALTRGQLLLHAAHQFAEGDVLHWWHPAPIDRGLRTRFADDLLWLPYAAIRYITATGDAAVLEEQVPSLQAEVLVPGQDENYVKPCAVPGASLFEHCCRALDRSLAPGPHGLPLMGTGDWNDGMNRVGRLGRGESVWLALFLHPLLGKFAAWCEARGEVGRASRYAERRASLAAALETAGWDGEWYLRAYFDSGTPLGTHEAAECRIDGLVQSWAVISGAASRERAEAALSAAVRHLVDERHGIIKLLTPAFVDMPEDPGYIKGYVAGVRENGGQYTHAACWLVMALAEIGQRDLAASLLRRLSPVWHARDESAVRRYKVEPYVVAADIYGEPPHVGRGGWTWYTGSAAWMFRVAVESILGLTIEDGKWLVLRPRVPDSWPGYRIEFTHDAQYRIEVVNPLHDASGIISASLDGVAVETLELDRARLPLLGDGLRHDVVITLGPAREAI